MQGKIPFIFYTIGKLTIPILFMGSLEDDMCWKDMLKEYIEMKKIVKYGSVHIFVTGKHPAIVSNAKKFTKLVLTF